MASYNSGWSEFLEASQQGSLLRKGSLMLPNLAAQLDLTAKHEWRRVLPACRSNGGAAISGHLPSLPLEQAPLADA